MSDFMDEHRNCDIEKQELSDQLDAKILENIALENRVAELESAAQWTSVRAYLPPLNQTVLVIDADGHYQLALRDIWGEADPFGEEPSKTAWFDNGLLGGEINVRYWRPLPVAPESSEARNAD